MKEKDPKELISMHGPSFDGSGEIVNREVVASDVAAYRQAGYELGSVPELEQLKQEVKAMKAAPKARGKK